MTDDIEIARIGMEQSSPAEEDQTDPPDQAAEKPSLFRRIGWVLVRVAAIFALLMAGLAVYHGAIESNTAVLGFVGGFWSLFPLGRSDGADDGGGKSNAGADEVETDGGAMMADATDQAKAARTRNKPEISITDLPKEVSTEQIVDVLMRRGEGRPLPDASAILTRIQRPVAATLEGVPNELGILRRDIGPVLIGVADNEKTVDTLADVFGLMLIISPKHEDHLDPLMNYVPALIQTEGISGLGSARTFSLPAPKEPGTDSESQATIKNLRLHKGNPRHPIARAEPDFIAAAAPPGWTQQVESILSDYAPVIDVIEWDKSEIYVAGFVFDSTIELPDHIVNPDSDRSGSAPRRNGTTTSHSGPEGGSGNEDRPAEPDGGGTQPRESNPSGTSATMVTPPKNSSRSQPVDVPDQEGDRRSPADPDTDSADQNGGGTAPAPNGPTDGTGSEAAPSDGADSDSSSQSSTSSGEPDGSSPGSSGSKQATDETTSQDNESGGGQDSPVSSRGRDDRSSGMAPDDGSSVPAGDPGASSSGSPQTRPGETSADQDNSTGADGAGNQGRSTEPGPDQPSRESGAPDESNGSLEPTPDGSGSNGQATDPESTGGERVAPPQDSGGASDTETTLLPDSSTGNGQVPEDPSGSDAAGTSPSGDTGDSPAPPDSGSDGGSPDADTGLTPGQLPPANPSGSSPGSGQHTGPESSTETPPPGESALPESSPVSTSPETPTSQSAGADRNDSGSSAGPPYDIDTGPGIVPSGEAPASSDPMIIDVMEHVLNELTYQATATPNREVYSTVFADEDGVIRHQHIIEHPDFLDARKNSIKFAPAFFKHLKRLSQQRKDINHRLAGGVHSHPNTGKPRQSPADKRFARKVWRNQRNTMFIIGIKEGDGPDDWTISDDGKEVRRQSNEYIVRVRAFSGENNPKKIRLHQDMGQ